MQTLRSRLPPARDWLTPAQVGSNEQRPGLSLAGAAPDDAPTPHPASAVRVSCHFTHMTVVVMKVVIRRSCLCSLQDGGEEKERR